jgi:hypothetical protein
MQGEQGALRLRLPAHVVFYLEPMAITANPREGDPIRASL